MTGVRIANQILLIMFCFVYVFAILWLFMSLVSAVIGVPLQCVAAIIVEPHPTFVGSVCPYGYPFDL